MAGELRATTSTTGRKADIHVRFKDRMAFVQSDRVLVPAWRLYKLRHALKQASTPPPPITIKLKLGRLPTITIP